MRSNRSDEHEGSSDDSFLDVVANVVGVLIILVMLVSASASQSLLTTDATPAEPQDELASSETLTPDEDVHSLRDQLDEAMQQTMASRRALQETAAQVVEINHEAAVRDQQRNQLALHRAVIKEDIELRRGKLDTHRQREFDVQRQIMESQIKLDEYAQEQVALAGAAETVKEIECVPTPLARTIEEKAIHLRLRKGMVSIVPLEELLEEVKFHIPDIRRQLQSRNEVSDTIGPLDGYRLRYTVIRKESARLGGPQLGQSPKTVHEQYAEVLPAAEDIGQNVEQALMPGAALYEHLQAHRRQPPPVVVWLYTDSFEAFGPLKRKLWEMGFSLATRPMELGARIGASPHGTKAAAQ